MQEITKRIIKAQNGDKEEFTKLIEENQGLIWNIVKRFVGRGYEKEDLYQIGNIGLIKAIRRFDTSFEVQLSTYAVPYIMGEIKRFIRDDGPIKVSRSLKELRLKINDIEKDYLEHGKEVSLAEIATILRMPKEEIVLAMEAGNNLESLEESYYHDNKTDSSISVVETLSTGKDEANIISDKLTLNTLIEHLSPREKEVISLRFYKDKTQMQVAKILGISQVQVSRIENKILKNMRSKLIV